MSGGYFDYKDMMLQNDIFGYDNKVPNVFEDRIISDLVCDVFDLIHEFDWYKSGDTSEDTYLKFKQKFKNKWLNIDSIKVTDIINRSLQETKEELYKTFDIEVHNDRAD